MSHLEALLLEMWPRIAALASCDLRSPTVEPHILNEPV
jgi:hypothetical protein